MNTTQPPSTNGPSAPTQKERATKALAIIGFLATIIIIAWLIFTTISSIPNIVASVASLFNNEEVVTLQIESGTTDLISGERTTITWDNVEQAGTFAFAYTCEDGLEVDLMTPEYGTQSISCDRYYNIGDLTTVNLVARSTQSESATLTYQIAFVPEANPDVFYPNEASLTVTNPNLVVIEEDEVTEDEPVRDEEETESETEDTTPTEEVDTTSPTDTVATVPPVQYREEIIYTIPESNPNGFTDLSIRLNSNGYLQNQTFVPSGSISRNQTGAIQFVVKNSGTRTSETWTYTAVLPNGQVYESPQQSALRPNEEATITLGFRPPSTSDWYDYTVNITTSRDSNRANHQISWGVAVN